MNVSKPVFISAILLSVMGTAAAYPFLVNVNVTNFPLDEQGNLKTTTKEEKFFPKRLVLRGIGLNTEARYNETKGWEHTKIPLLIDQDTPYPLNIDSAYVASITGSYEWARIYDKRFIYETLSLKSYQIQGQVVTSFRIAYWSYYGNYLRFNVTYYFEKINDYGIATVLASGNMTMVRSTSYTSFSGDVSNGFIFKFETPITIQTNERLAVRLTIDAKTDASTLSLHHYLAYHATGNEYYDRDFGETNNLNFAITIPITY